MVVMILVKAYYLSTDFSLCTYLFAVPQMRAGRRWILFGQYSWAFWGLQLFLGMIVPLIILITPKTSHGTVGWVDGPVGLWLSMPDPTSSSLHWQFLNSEDSPPFTVLI